MKVVIACAMIFVSHFGYAQEGDDAFSNTKFKLRPYVTGYAEKRWYIKESDRLERQGDVSQGFAFGGHFRFAHFNCPLRVGLFRQTSLRGVYPKSSPERRQLQGVEFSLGYTGTEGLTGYLLFRGGKYGTETWQFKGRDNELGGFVGGGLSYRFNIGSEQGGFSVETGMQIGGSGSEAATLIFSITGRPYW